MIDIINFLNAGCYFYRNQTTVIIVETAIRSIKALEEKGKVKIIRWKVYRKR